MIAGEIPHNMQVRPGTSAGQNRMAEDKSGGVGQRGLRAVTSLAGAASDGRGILDFCLGGVQQRVLAGDDCQQKRCEDNEYSRPH